jgi:predicted Zn-dependent protease
LARHPDNVDALASLGYIAIEQGRLDDAEAPLKRAIALDPKNAAVLYDYARVPLKRRDYAEAVARLKRVVAEDPAHTQAFYQLFLSYTRLKEKEKADAALAEFKRLEALEKQVTQERIMDERLRTQQILGSSPQ